MAEDGFCKAFLRGEKRVDGFKNGFDGEFCCFHGECYVFFFFLGENIQMGFALGYLFGMLIPPAEGREGGM